MWKGPDGISLNAAVCVRAGLWGGGVVVVVVRGGSGPGAIKQKLPPVTRSMSERRRTIPA